MGKIPDNVWYDIEEDWPLIEASFAKQYNIRLRENLKMPFSEFQELLSGLMHDTPLGSIIGIRSETDKDTIKRFTPDMKREYDRWRRKKSEEKLKEPEKLDAIFAEMEKMFANAYSN
jgi:hypothetical protein